MGTRERIDRRTSAVTTVHTSEMKDDSSDQEGAFCVEVLMSSLSIPQPWCICT